MGRGVDFGFALPFASGTETSIAINGKGVLLEIHRAARGDALLYRIGAAHQADIRAALHSPPGMGVDPRAGMLVVMVNGRPLSTRWTAEHVPAIVEAWRPGEQGGTAVADVLFGEYNPSGRLPVTIPRHVGQLPSYYNYKPSKEYWITQGWTNLKGYVDMPGTPLYPFGHGLSYTKYEYSNLRIEPAS